MIKAEFLQRTNNFQLYDTVFKQAVYTGTQEDCKRVLNSSINPAYYRDFIIVEVS